MAHAQSFDYQRRVIAFIDVLGFRQLVTESNTDLSKWEKVTRLIETDKQLEECAEKYSLSDVSNVTFFSDSFVISATANNMVFLVREVGYLCRRLLILGLPCRGAIAVGSVYHHGRIAVGPAFVAAYEMEKNSAIYPRIILDKGAARSWKKECAPDFETSRLRTLIKKGHDGQSFLDIFHPAWFEFIPQADFIQVPNPIPTDQANFLKVASKQIKKGLVQSGNNERVYAKYLWLDSQCNEHLNAGR